MAFTFLAAQGVSVGVTQIEADRLEVSTRCDADRGRPARGEHCFSAFLIEASRLEASTEADW